MFRLFKQENDPFTEIRIKLSDLEKNIGELTFMLRILKRESVEDIDPFVNQAEDLVTLMRGNISFISRGVEYAQRIEEESS